MIRSDIVQTKGSFYLTAAMIDTQHAPDEPTEKSDIPVGSWIDRYMPVWAQSYLKLARMDRPIGTWLLLWPCLWAIVLTTPGGIDAFRFDLMGLFIIGAIVMRGAGCTYNDIVDRDFDAKVARTALRPIPSGAVSVEQACTFLGLQLLVGLVVLLQFNPLTIGLGIASLVLVVTYPFMKRITFWPQVWLGLTFNWGALMGWTAVTGSIAWPAAVLYAAGFFWTLGYDTIYAHQDKEDDALIGVKSSALALGHQTLPFVIAMYTITIVLLALAAGLVQFSWITSTCLFAAACQFTWQAATLDTNDAANCLTRFKSNREIGFIVVLALLGVRL